jgi:hypothetical protein
LKKEIHLCGDFFAVDGLGIGITTGRRRSENRWENIVARAHLALGLQLGPHPLQVRLHFLDHFQAFFLGLLAANGHLALVPLVDHHVGHQTGNDQGKNNGYSHQGPVHGIHISLLISCPSV